MHPGVVPFVFGVKQGTHKVRDSRPRSPPSATMPEVRTEFLNVKFGGHDIREFIHKPPTHSPCAGVFRVRSDPLQPGFRRWKAAPPTLLRYLPFSLSNNRDWGCA